MLPGTVGAYDGERLLQVLLFHKFLEDQHSRHPQARGRDLAREARQSIYDDVGHHRLYSERCDTARPTVSGSHPFLVAPETPSKKYPASNRLPARDPPPNDIHSYR